MHVRGRRTTRPVFLRGKGKAYTRRVLILVAAPALGNKAVAHPRLGLDVLFSSLSFELFAELTNKDAEILWLVGRLRSPDRGEQGAMRHDLPGIAGQVKEEVELLWSEVDGFPQDGDGVPDGIHHKVAVLNGSGGALGRSPEMSAHAGQKLLYSEWFGDIIVGTGVEGFNLGAFVVADGEDQHRTRGLGADGAANFNTADTGHHQVCDDEVWGPIFEEKQTFFGIICGSYIESLSGERRTKDAGDLRFVIDDHDSGGHGILCTSNGSLHHPGRRV